MSATAAPSQFEALLGEITTLAKSDAPTGDAAIAAAAGEPAEAPAAGDKVDPEVEDAAEPMGKSFTIKLDDGTEVEAMDGAGLIKALGDRCERLEGAFVVVATLAKSQAAEIATLKAAGKVRKSVVAIAERPAAAPLAKSDEPAGMSGADFMAKAMTACTAGKITGRMVSIAEQYVNMGQSPPADIVSAVLAA